MVNDANIIEIFSSIQGEGPYIGYRQIFVRFANCNLNCNYCDTPFNEQKLCKIETHTGSETFKEIENPIVQENLVNIISGFLTSNHHSISLTGGEPLLHSDYIMGFIDKLRLVDNKTKIYLETNGTLVKFLDKTIGKIDIISMDIKLESSCGVKTQWDAHRDFVKIALENKKEIFAKIVVTTKITTTELNKITEFIKDLPVQIPVIIQPISSYDKSLIPNSKKLLDIQEFLSVNLFYVRMIPQVHKFLNMN